jgi:hypothetical protein
VVNLHKGSEYSGLLINLRDLFLWLDRVNEEDLYILGGLPALVKLRLYIPEFEDSRKSRVIVSAAHGFSCLRMFIYNIRDKMDLMFVVGSSGGATWGQN